MSCYPQSFPVFVCPECRSFVEVRAKTLSNAYAYILESGVHCRLRCYQHFREDTPEDVLSTLEEALKCHGTGAWNACAVLARKSIEVMATDLGGQGHSLYSKLEDLNLRGIVAAHFIRWDHTIRNLGNAAVHYDPDDPYQCDYPEATCALAYAYEVSKRIYLLHRLDVPPPETWLEGINRNYRQCLLDSEWYSLYGINTLIYDKETQAT